MTPTNLTFVYNALNHICTKKLYLSPNLSFSGYNTYWNSGKGADSGAATADASISNEDSSTRTFQRTTSAQVRKMSCDFQICKYRVTHLVS